MAHFVIKDYVNERGIGIPIVAFGYDNGETYQFVPAKDVNDISSLFGEALLNLGDLDYPWELGDSHGLRFATSSGKEFCAERLLDPDAMLKCHQLLESDRITVAAPRRTCLFAAAYDLPEEQEITFNKLVIHTYNDDSYGHAPIAPVLFYLEKGRIDGFGFIDLPDNPAPPRETNNSEPQLSSEQQKKPWWKLW